MEIVKELNLNGNPQVVPNGSLVYAKNLKVSIDGTYITNDDGFSICFDDTQDSENLRNRLKVSNIKGTKVNNIFIDTYEYTIEIDGETKTIHREYMIQKFVGNINCPNEIVIFVYKEYTDTYTDTHEIYKEGEEHNIYRAVEFKDSNKFALFLVNTGWHYDGGIVIGTYTYNVYGHLIIAIAESEADIDKQLLTIDLNTSNSQDSLSKYSCAPNIPIANLSLSKKIKGKAMRSGLYYFFIRYEISDKLYTNWFPIGAPQYALSLDYKSVFNHIYAIDSSGDNTKNTNVSLLINTNKDSYYNFNFVLTFDKYYNYIGFQIGYILQTEDTAVGRIWNGFNFTDGELAKDFLFDGGYIEEVDIEDLTRNVLNVYNVKALSNYNSKLYVANFKETEYNVDLRNAAANINTYLIKQVVDIEEVEKGSTIMNTWTYSINGSTCSITIPETTVSMPLKDFPDLKNLIVIEGDFYGHGAEIPFDLDIFTLLFKEGGVFLTPSVRYRNGIEEGVQYTTGMDGSTLIIDSYNYLIGGGETLEEEYSGGFMVNNVYCTKSTGVQNYKTYNTDNVVRTLMPYEVYAFYVHYVRPDGSYTNGIPLENKNNSAVCSELYTKIRDLDSEQLENYNLTDIATIDEIKDKYLYELYIRDSCYAKTYFDVYLDSKGKKLFRTNSGICHVGNNVYMLQLGVRFENIEYPEGYVGAFFSYEKINSLSVYQGYVSDNLTENSNIIVKGNDCESAGVRYDGTLFIPHHKITDNGIESIQDQPYYSYINNAAPILSNSAISFEGSNIDRTGIHGGIAMNLSKKDTGSDVDDLYKPAVGIVGSIIIFNTSVYSNEVKELIPFGPITTTSVYGEDVIDSIDNLFPNELTDIIIRYDMNYPSYLTQDKILTYADKIFINENLSLNTISGNVISTDSYFEDDDYAKVTTVWKYSNLNLLALEFKKEPEGASGVIKNNRNTINTLVRPINASDLFKLESCYIPQIHKAYTNYNKYIETFNTFTNVVRCSYPIRNESGINSWRLFDPLKYYIIDNSNGEIVHIFGAGTSFFIHTKNNLLVTSSNAKIMADNTTIHLQENNIFDVPPSEIFTSDLGYGGLKYQYCQLLSQFGYIWYDTDRRKLFRWDNGNLIDINSGIDEIIKRYKFEHCSINIDNNSNRIFFCFYNNMYDALDKILTLAYNTLNNKWLSCYDFRFDLSIHTANVVLFALKREYDIYSYDSNADLCDYKLIRYENPDFPEYSPTSSSDKSYFCFDVIFNSGYNIPKVLDSINWVHELIKQHIINGTHPAQFKLEYESIKNRVHDLDGVSVIVYSDSVDSGIINLECNKLNDVANVNNPNGYKYPYYNKGVWNLSYFRNAITTPVTDEELNALVEEYGTDTVAKLKNAYKVIDRNNVTIYRPSDMRTLIYGKYIAVRFIFKTDKRVKFDNLEFNIQKY